jgi:hypothetical protein
MHFEEPSSWASNGALFDENTARPTKEFANLLNAIGIDPDTAPPCLLDKLRVPFGFDGDHEDLLDLMYECGIRTSDHKCYNSNKVIEEIRSEVERWCHHRTAEGVKNHKAKEKIID